MNISGVTSPGGGLVDFVFLGPHGQLTVLGTIDSTLNPPPQHPRVAIFERPSFILRIDS